MVFLRSVVGKLWFTILLLVSFVLLILTVLLLEFFENFNTQQVENDLAATAVRVVKILEEHDASERTLELSSRMLDDSKDILIVYENMDSFSSETDPSGQVLSLQTVLEDKDLSKVLKEEAAATKKRSLDDSAESEYIVVGEPFDNGGTIGAVYVSQSLDSMRNTAESTTKFIILAAGVAIILTTIFAFFLSTRITAPLRKMREAAFEVARGKFDTKLPTPSSDEIGALATAFNQMGRQLKYNMNALSQEKENLASVLSSMADGVITINIDGTILATNPPADRFIQYWFNENKENAESSNVPPELMQLFQNSIESEQEQVGDVQIGDHYWVIIVSPLYNNKNTRGAVAVLRDMTEEHKLEKMRNDFIANVSHELRTPISMLQGYSEAIVDDIAESQEEKRELAKIIYDESLRMGRLVNDLLDLARMEAGHINLHYETIELGPYLDRVTSKFAGLAKDKGVQVELYVNDGDTAWNLDPDRIEQVMTNLIDNAIRHTPNGGQITIQQNIIHGNQLHLEVKNTGPGIPAKDLPFIFERFYKADKARTRGNSGTGTGLGLAIAQNIVKAHKGEISVESSEGKETTFSFIIPQVM